MHCFGRFIIAATTLLALGTARAEQAGLPAHPAGHPTPHPVAHAVHACLDQKERRAAEQTGRLVHLAVAIRAAKKRMPGTVVGARLCHGGNDELVYVLIVLARDGKVARLSVDAAKGTLVGQR